MKKMIIRRGIQSFLVVFALILSTGTVFASTSSTVRMFNQISETALIELKEAGIADEDILSLCQQIDVYNLSEVQIENYINGLIERTKTIKSFAPIDYEKTEKGDSITPDGIIPFQDIASKWSSVPINRAKLMLVCNLVLLIITGRYI